MKGTIIKVLIIDDDKDDALLAREYLLQSTYYIFDPTWEPIASKAKQRMVNEDFDIFLIDYRLGAENGLDIIQYAQSKGVLKPFILLTGQDDAKLDINASRIGAADYLVKAELNGSMLERSIRYALSQYKIIRELDEKEKKYSSLFERSVDPIFLANNNLNLIDLNSAFLSLFGYSREELRKLAIHEIFSNNADYRYFCEILMAQEQIKDFEVQLVNKVGKKLWGLLNCVFIPNQSSNFCCYQGIIHDLTMRKKVEKELREADHLVLTGKMARTIAHEIRNPLTNLNMAMENIKEELSDLLGEKEELKIYTEIITRNAKRIEVLISDILNSSNPNKLELELVEVNQVLEETLELAFDRIRLNNVKVEKLFSDNNTYVFLDKGKIKIALLNIIINAVEAMVDIAETNRTLRISTIRKDDTIMITISDTGKGILPDHLEKLFEPFFTNKPNGLGLGLTSTKNILNNHNANIQVISQIGKGSSFSILFNTAE